MEANSKHKGMVQTNPVGMLTTLQPATHKTMKTVSESYSVINTYRNAAGV